MPNANERETRDRPVRWRAALIAFSLLPLGLLLLALALQRRETVEQVYSAKLFPPLRRALSGIAGLAPFSLAQLLLVAAAAWVVWRIARGLAEAARGRRRLGNLAAHAVAQTLACAGPLYAAFLGTFGLHFARLPLAAIVGLETAEPSAAELTAVAEELARRCDELRAALDPGACRLARGPRDPRIDRAYGALAASLPALSGPLPPVRRPALSALMPWLGVSGIYSPFTGEAHVPPGLPAVSDPFTACHEVAHALGFAREDEANFVAFLACRASDDPAFAYSGARAGLALVLEQLSDADFERASQIAASLTPEVRDDFEGVRTYWRSKASWLTAVGRTSNELYLRSQGQAEGVASYGRMVDLLVADLRARSQAAALR